MEFMRDYPDDAACLEHLWRSRYSPDGEHAECPKCEQERVFRKYPMAQGRQSWICTACGWHVHPTAGTIFHKSSTSLHLWFFAIYMITSTRCGVSAKMLEREIGVSYRTAWRMLNLIRNQVMTDDGEPLRGDVEVDEASVDGKPRKPQGQNRQINHSAGWYVQGDTHTNTVEGFFGHRKPSIRGTYRRVSHRWLQGYLNEFVWRRNARLEPGSMFETLLERTVA